MCRSRNTALKKCWMNTTHVHYEAQAVFCTMHCVRSCKMSHIIIPPPLLPPPSFFLPPLLFPPSSFLPPLSLSPFLLPPFSPLSLPPFSLSPYRPPSSILPSFFYSSLILCYQMHCAQGYTLILGVSNPVNM